MSNEYKTALKLAQGQTIDRKDVGDIKQVSMILKSFKNNCNKVIKQLSEA